MELQINCMQSLYRKMEMSQRKNKGYFSIMSNETETSLNSLAQEKVQRGFSIHDAYSIMKSSGTKFSVGNLATVSENLDKRVDTERYSIESTSEIAGYWQIYDKTLNQTFVLNPDTTTLQTDTNTNKNYIVFQNVFGEPENVMYADNELVGALKQFLNTDSIPTTSLNENYVIDINKFTGIESLKVKGNEGAGSWNLICNQEQKEKLRSYWGVDEPPVQRYLNWLNAFIKGDGGISLLYRQPVTKVIAVKLGNSLFLMGLAWVVSGLVGFLLGVLAGVFQGRLPDKIIKGYSLVIASTPSFWLALLLLIIFGVWMKILPIGLSVPIGVEASGVSFLDRVRHAILPAVTLSITGISNITLHTREKMIDIMESDYILFAKARGEKTGSIIFHHGIRNVLLPAMTLQFASVSEIIGGSVLVEQVFSYPGLGQAAVAAGTGSDVPLLMGITLITAAIVFLGNFLANVLYGVVDPRIRKGGLGL